MRGCACEPSTEPAAHELEGPVSVALHVANCLKGEKRFVCEALVSLECTFCSSVLNHGIFFHLDKSCLLGAFSATLSRSAQLRQGLGLSWLQSPGTMIRSQLTSTE